MLRDKTVSLTKVNKIAFSFKMYILCVYMGVQYPQRPEEGIRFPGTGKLGLLTTVGVLGPEPQSSVRAKHTLNG